MDEPREKAGLRAAWGRVADIYGALWAHRLGHYTAMGLDALAAEPGWRGLDVACGSGESTALTTKAAAAVLIYRALTFLLPIPIGAGCYVFWRVNKSWRRTPEERARTSKRPRATVTA